MNISGSSVLQDFRNKADLLAIRGQVEKSFIPDCLNPIQTRSGSVPPTGVSLRSPASGPLDGWDEAWKVLNGATVSMDWTCTFATQCKNCCNGDGVKPYLIMRKCTLNFSLRDRFANPFDIGVEIHGESYEWDHAKFLKCMSDCTKGPGYQPRDKHSCITMCNRMWPVTELAGGSAYDIFGSWSETQDDTLLLNPCD